MIIILKRNANKEKVENLKTELVNQGFKLHLSKEPILSPHRSHR